MMPRNQQSNHEMALLHSSPRNINGVRTLQADVGFQILPNGSSVHYFCCSVLQAGGGRCSSAASPPVLHGTEKQHGVLRTTWIEPPG